MEPQHRAVGVLHRTAIRGILSFAPLVLAHSIVPLTFAAGIGPHVAPLAQFHTSLYRSAALRHRALPIALAADEQAPQSVRLPGRLVVKYRDSVDACAHCLLEHRTAFATVTDGDSLDRLHAELGVHHARPVFFDRHGQPAALARAALGRFVDRVRARFPERTQRATPGATMPDLTNVYELLLDENTDVETAAALYAADPNVIYAHPVTEARISSVPNDPFYSSFGSWGQAYEDLWGLHWINTEAAWDLTSGAGVVVAIVDTGIDHDHADLAGHIWTNPGEIPNNGIDDDANGYVDDVAGWDFRNRDNDPDDRNGHGSHVAAIAAGVGNDGYGVPGVAYDATIMPLKGLSDEGFGATTELAQAIVYAAENGADVVNNSWGGFGPNAVVYDAIAAANALGVVVVSAAGNDGRRIDNLLWLPAGHPDGVTVGALDPSGQLAWFSNFGPFQSVVAPGVDILSARSHVGTFDNDLNVGSSWVRLSGTSMATPHVTGAAALLLAAQPSLTTEEARWRLELNAAQPGWPGYEGELHNPYFGYGILDAASMFDTPPVTTRLTPPGVTRWHAFAEEIPVPGAPARFAFTSSTPVPWTVTTPSGLSATMPTGAGASTLDLRVDTRTLAVGDYEGDVILSSPSAIDAGASFAAKLHVHADVRDGTAVAVAHGGFGTSLGYSPLIVSNGLDSLVVWHGFSEHPGLAVAALAGDGTVSEAVDVAPGAVYNWQAASDGRDYLVAWNHLSFGNDSVDFLRVGADGRPVDAAPISIAARSGKNCATYRVAGVGYDGIGYWVAYKDDNFCRNKETYYLARVYSDGSFARPVRALRLRTSTEPVFTCRSGSCLLAYWDRATEGYEPETQKRLYSAYSVAFEDGEIAAGPTKVVTDLFGLSALATDGERYVALGIRYVLCAPGDLCRSEVIATRMDANGFPLDSDAIVVSNIAPSEREYPWPGSLIHDGTDWVVSYQATAVDDSEFDDGNYLFVNRIDDAGVPQATEHTGALIDSAGRASETRLAATATGTLVVFEDGRNDPLAAAYPHPDFSDLLAQRVYPKEPGPDFPDREIGSIGSYQIDEGEFLRFRVTAPGLSPSATFTAPVLPPGAVFDPRSRLFQWKAASTDGGSSYAATFHAEDVADSANETIVIDVRETITTVTGHVRDGDGTPLGGIALNVKGTPDGRRTVFSDPSGNWRIDGIAPAARLRVRLGRPSKKQWRTLPSSISMSVVVGDNSTPDLIATPK